VRREVKSKAGSDPLKAGEQIVVSSVFAEGDVVDVIATSKGRGFQGVIKRHNFRGGAATHGSMFHRAPGGIGASSYPSRVIRGKKLPGHMGDARVTERNLRVVRIDADNHLLLVRGAVPGAPGGYVVIRKAIAAKPIPKPQPEKPTKGKK
jgi:large subunit ribosomal protein L3